MQAIKMAALQEAENTSRRIREQTAWFYLRHMNIDEDTSPSTAFHALLTRKERESLPTPQGEKEKEVRSQLCTRSALLEAQLYDTINAYTKLFIMNDASLPDDLRKKLNAELEQFNAQTTQMLTDKSADCVRRNASADQMAEELLEVFNKAAKKLAGDIDGAYIQASWYYLLHQFAKAGYREFRHVVEHKAGLCETCLSLSEQTFTLEELVQQELLPPLHPNCRCVIVPVYETGMDGSRTSGGFSSKTTNWYDGLLQIPAEAKALLNGFVSAQQERIGRGTLGGFLDWLTMGTISGFYDGLKTRASAVFENPSLYNITNWLTLGTADTVKGAVAPEKPLSLEHWLDSIGVVSIALGAYELAQKYAPAAIDDVAAFENAAAQNAAEINLPEDALIVRDTKYLDESGHVDYLKYALDDGFVAGTKHIETLDTGVLIDRYGGPGGDFTAPKGTPYKMRSLPYYKNQNVYHIYRVIKPIENVEAGTIAPAFGEPGGGIQYKLPAPIEKLLGEYLEEVTQ